MLATARPSCTMIRLPRSSSGCSAMRYGSWWDDWMLIAVQEVVNKQCLLSETRATFDWLFRNTLTRTKLPSSPSRIVDSVGRCDVLVCCIVVAKLLLSLLLIAEWSIVTSMSVCVSVCKHVSETTHLNWTNFYSHFACAHCSVLLRLCAVKLETRSKSAAACPPQCNLPTFGLFYFSVSPERDAFGTWLFISWMTFQLPSQQC